MDQNESSDPPVKRYNTRPKSKTGLASLESKYSAYILDTSPKHTRKSRNPPTIDYSNYQRYVQSQMGPVDTKESQLSTQSNFIKFQAYQAQNEPMNSIGFQRTAINSNFGSIHQPNRVSLPPQMNIIYKNQLYGMNMNYQAPRMPNVMVPHSQAVRGINTLIYNPEHSPYNVVSDRFGQNVNFPMRINHNYKVTHPGYIISQARQGYISHNFNVNVPFSRPTHSDTPVNTLDKMSLPHTFDINNVLYHQRMVATKQDVKQQGDLLPKHPSDGHVSTASKAEEINRYFKAVDVILKDSSDGSNFQRSEDSSFGLVSVLDGFKNTDSYTMVNFEYTISDQVYLEMTKYLDCLNSSDIQFPVNITNANKKNVYKAGTCDTITKNSSADSENGGLNLNTNSESNDKINEVDIEFNNNNIRVKHEKKIFPITMDSYKQLSTKEAQSFMSLLKSSIVLKINPISKHRVKSIINKNNDMDCHYYIYLSDDSMKEYALKQQFGYFIANSFLNKRVPLYRKVDFYKTDPSFLFGVNSNKKSSKLAHIYLKSSRSYDVYLTNLNMNLNVELSKLISESEADFNKDDTYKSSDLI